MTRFSSTAPWLLATLVVIVDQVTKFIVTSSMNLHQSIPFFGDIVRWTYIHNRGMAFGVQLTGGRLLGLVSILATIFFSIILYKSRTESLSLRLILGAIIGGAVGNTIDRMIYGHVIDFIDVDLPNWLMDRWPIFNVADSAVSVGIVLLIVLLLFKPGTMSRVAKKHPAGDNVVINPPVDSSDSFKPSPVGIDRKGDDMSVTGGNNP